MGEDWSDDSSSRASLRQPSSLLATQTVDPALDSKASQLEGEVRQQNTSIKSVLDNLKHLEGSQLPNVASTLQNLRTSIERVIVADIPNSLRPLEDDATRVRQKFDKFSSDTQTRLQGLHSKLSETSGSISQLLARYQDLSETTRGSVSEIDSDLQRSKETLESASQRLSSMESGLAQSDAILQSLKSEIHLLARGFTEKVSQFQGETTSSFSATASHLSQELKNERQVRTQTMGAIDQQIREVYRNTTDAMNRMTSFLSTTKSQYQQALSALAKGAKDGLVGCGSASSEGFGELSDRMDQFVGDSNAQFESLESDVTSTIQALRQHIVSAREGLENAIQNVSRSRINGESEIVAKYDALKTSLSQQLRQQAAHMESVSQSAVQSVTEHCDSVISQIREELARVKGQIDRIARLESRVSNLAASTEQTRSQLVEQISSLGQRYGELLASVERVEREFEQRQEAIESRLSFLEDPENQPNYATKAELDDIVRRTQAMFDGRLQEIEGQIGQVFQSISELTLNGARPGKRTDQPAADILGQLAADT